MPTRRALLSGGVRRSLVALGVGLALDGSTLGAQKAPAVSLGNFASQRLIVLPVQTLRGDAASWVTAPAWEKFRRELDDSLSAALAARGPGRGWAYSADVARLSRRNALYTRDPYAIAVERLRGQPYKADDHIPDAMAGSLRTLVALSDARYALVPVELVFEKQGERQRAVLRLALIDARLGTLVWVGDAATDAAATIPAGLAGLIAQKAADFVAPKN